ncbi:MAG: hypothetical protein KDD62_15560, partial [Bdellovibrionales bacterium]|nr:hypothetical protein [Bdellovibrionales bacterium]
MVSFLVTWLGILMASVLVGVVVGGIVFAATQSDGAGKFVGFATIVITGMLIHPHINWGDEKQGDLAQAQSLVDGQSESLDATPSQDTSAPNDSGSRSWIVKFADGGFFYVALIAMLVGFVAGIGLFMYEKYDPITSLLFGELLLLFFIGVFPIGLALTALFSWILLAAIVTTVVCMASGHPHYAAAIAIIVAVVLHFAGAWDAVSFVSNNRIGIGILAAAWVAAGYAEALFEWRKIELSRSIAAKKKGDSFYRERKLDPTAEIPFELKMEATQFALANLEVIDVGSI